MSNSVTFFDLVISSGGAIAAVISAWVHMKMTVANLKNEISYIKKELTTEKAENKENYTLLTAKIDNLIEAINLLKIEISKK